MPEVILIAAFPENRVIGKNGQIPWNIPEDLSHFKSTTMGGAVIFGRKTFQSIGRALPGRLNLVISRTLKLNEENLNSADSLQNGIEICKKAGYEKIFICGGEQIYKTAIAQNLCTKMILSEIHNSFFENLPEGDAFFPEINENKWLCTRTEAFKDFTVRTLSLR